MPKVEMETLLNALLPHAMNRLAEFAEFFPYAGALLSDGTLRTVDHGDDTPLSLEAWRESLEQSLRQGARSGEFNATGLVLNVEIDVPGQTYPLRAILVALEHQRGDCYHVFVPYRIGDDGVVQLGDTVALAGDSKVFASTSTPEPVELP